MRKSNGRKDELECLRHRYEGRGKEAKPRMFEEFCEHYGYERKHATKLFGGDQLPKPNGEARARAQPLYEPVREVPVAQVGRQEQRRVAVDVDEADEPEVQTLIPSVCPK